MKNYRDPQWNFRKISCVVITGVRVLNHIPYALVKEVLRKLYREREKMQQR